MEILNEAKMCTKIRMLLSLAVAALACWGTQAAEAQERERAGIIVGTFVTDRASETRLDSTTSTGTDIDLEADLGLETSTTVGRFGAYVWIKPRQRFDFSYFDLSRSADHRIEETIDFGDETFTINTIVSTENKLKILKTDYTFAPLTRDRGYLGVTGGLYIGSLKFSISEPTFGMAETEDVTAPLPVLGFRGEFDITDRITLGGASQWFAIDAGDVSGRLHDFYLGADYRFGKRMAVGLGYNTVSMNVEADDIDGRTGRLDWSYDGWLLYLKANLGMRR